MKKILGIIAIFILFIGVFHNTEVSAEASNSIILEDLEIDELIEIEDEDSNESEKDEVITIDEEKNEDIKIQEEERDKQMRGVWVATIYGLDFPSKSKIGDIGGMKDEINEIVGNSKQLGFNTIFFQVRPTADAFYKSEIFPWSKYLTGKNGRAPIGEFDPLKYFIKVAHENDIELHAWINPYRVAANESDFKALDPKHPAKIHSEWVVEYGYGEKKKYYFNPGIPAVEKLINEGVKEIINNYDVDGIHLDDYFYPGEDFDDENTYNRYGFGYFQKGNWRRENINRMIYNLDKTIDSIDENISFGISPFGIWANKKNNELGSDTDGTQSYYKMSADSLAWIKGGYIDYIIPQIYWNIGHEQADYKTLVQWWNNAVEGYDVKLYIGQGAYRLDNPAKGSPWVNGVREFQKQMELNEIQSNVEGFVMFNYSSIMRHEDMQRFLKKSNIDK